LKVIGIDCAVQPKNVGVAVGFVVDRKVNVTDANAGAGTVVERVVSEIEDSAVALLALDSPLGWPVALGAELAAHRAGQPIITYPNRVFRRDTDRFVRQQTGKQPLDVGADRIARAAWAALTLLADIRERTGKPIELAWRNELTEPACIEVYPAATLETHGLSSRGYKGNEPHHRQRRATIVAALAGDLTMPDSVAAKAIANDHVLDAVICLVAAADFLAGSCALPADADSARREGWIWFKSPSIGPKVE
jgi:hypothetical protein